MDLLEKFAAVDIRPTDCLTEADRQFCQRQQGIYQDAVESFYQIAALWAGLCSRQEAALSEPKGLAHFETGAFEYPDGIDDLLSEDEYLWYDLLEFEDCEKLEKLRLFKNGRMDIRFTNEGWARQFVTAYLGTVW